MTLGQVVVFAGYSGLLYLIKLTSQDSGNMAEKVTKIKIPNSLGVHRMGSHKLAIEFSVSLGY